MSKNKQQLWLLLILLSYLVIALAGFGIAYVVKMTFLHPRQQTVQRQTIPALQTYTNATYKLSFSYPSSDSIQTSSFRFGITNLSIQNTKNNSVDFQILLLPKSLAHAVGQDFAGYYAMPDNSTRTIKSPFAKDTTTEKFTKIRNRTINGNQAIDYQAVASTAKAGSQPEIGTLIEAGNNLILISTEEKNKEKLEQLLGTINTSMR